jgi:hypothetical protein
MHVATNLDLTTSDSTMRKNFISLLKVNKNQLYNMISAKETNSHECIKLI